MGLYGCLLVFLCYSGLANATGADDFSSNLFSDIAPLIALFGEQVAKQYLSQSLGFLENLIFACAPLGILTTVTCAIRVGGPVALRALIGRAQEPAVQVELDLLRSTSSDVCELWDGRQVVRLTGSPEIVELVYDENGAVYTRAEAMKRNPHSSSWWRSFSSIKRTARDFELQELEVLVSESQTAPNISLNGGSIHANEVRAVALTALALQAGVIIFFFLSVYNLDLSLSISSDPPPDSALPVTAAGTLAVITGVFICTSVVEARTRLTRWIPKDKSHSLQIMWLQKAQVLNDQHFQSCAIFADKSRHEIISSVYNSKRSLEIWTCFGTAITTIGFICQLIGLRQMHYTAAVAQFVATVIMSILRVVIRRHYTRRPARDYDPTEPLNTFGIVELSDGHEFSEIAKRLSRCKSWIVYTGFNIDIHGFSEEPDANSLARNTLHTRLTLKAKFGDFWFSDASTSLEFNELVEGVENTVNNTIRVALALQCNASRDIEADAELNGANELTCRVPHWMIEVATLGGGPNLAKLDIPIKMTDGYTYPVVDKSDIEAVLAMWLAQLYHDGHSRDSMIRKRDNLWLLPSASEIEYEIWQVMLDFLIPGMPSLISVGDVLEACEQNHVDAYRVFRTVSVSGTPDRAMKRAMMTKADMFGMCGQYLAMSFVSQNVALLKTRHKDLSIDNVVIEDSRRGVKIKDPLFNEMTNCFWGTSAFDAKEDAQLFAFCILCQTGDFPDPLLLLPEILKHVTTLEKDEATIVCSRLRKVSEWKTKNLLGKNLRTEAAEMCLGIIGAFNEELGCQNAETQKLRELVKEAMSESISVNQDKNISGPSLSGTSVNGNISEAPAFQNNAGGDTLYSHRVLDEDRLKTLIEEGDVENFRMSLVLFAVDNPVTLNSLLLQAFFTVTDSITFNRTEIIRLLVLSGSGCETYRFNSRSLMSFAVDVGNAPLAELIMKKESKTKGAELYDHRQLRMAIKNGHEELVKVLLKFGGDIDAGDQYNGGVTALCTAALFGQERIARYLLSLGASVKPSTQAGQSALSFAARNNHNTLGKLLIDEELKASSRYINSHGIGFQYEQGRTSLHLVAAEGNMDLVLALLEAGWDLNGGGCQFTPVLDAIYHNHEHIAKFLIDRGSRVDQELLKPAAGHGLVDLVRILLSKGVDANAPCYGQTALEAAVTTKHNPERQFELVKLLLESGANVRNTQGDPLVLKAAISGHEDVAILLIEVGAPLEGKGDGGTTIVHYAAEHGYIGVIRAAVAKGAMLDLQDNNGRTPLHLAAYKGHAELIRILLEAGGGEWVDRKNKSKCTALHDAVTANNVEAARVLVEHGASFTCQTYPGYNNSTPLAQAVTGKRAEIVRIFTEKGATPDEKIHGNIIRIATEGGDLPTIKALLSVDPKTSPSYHEYVNEALDHAIQRDKVDVIKLLLELGADISNGEAFRLALNYSHGMEVAGVLFNYNRSELLPFVIETYLKAAAANHAKTIRYWLTNGLPVDVRNKDGETALHMAAKSLAIEALGALLEGNPKSEFVNARSNTGATALYAVIDTMKRRHPDRTLKIIQLLVEHGASHHFGVNQVSPARAHLATPREYVISLELADVVAYFDEVEKKEG